MRWILSLILACCIIALLLVAGCANITAKQQVGSFGTSSEEQQAINWFIATYGDPRINNNQPPRFVLPIITTAVDSNNLPTNDVTTFPVSGGSVYFFVIYEHFQPGDPITVTWTYLENGNVVSTVNQQAGGNFGRFNVEFQPPTTGWGLGRQEIVVAGNGTSAKVDFTIGNTLQTVPLPYNPTQGSVTTATTTSGITTCPTGETPCANTCVYTGVDLHNCGACGNVCPSNYVCQAGVCVMPTTTTTPVACPTGDLLCLNTCVNPATDSQNCGACGNACPGNYVCKASACEKTCPTGDILCLNNCVNPQTDSSNCGACGVACPSNEMCVASACECAPGYTRCVNGCMNTQSDASNCGACGNACPSNSVCAAGVCECATGFTLCGNVCVNTSTDSSHCGACTVVCPSGATCKAGSCVMPTLVPENPGHISIRLPV